jgi:hypothetical protein
MISFFRCELLFNQKGQGIVTPFLKENDKKMKKTGGIASGGRLKSNQKLYAATCRRVFHPFILFFLI